MKERKLSAGKMTNMPTDHYNPCADGFAAKAWECLRRSKKFEDATGGYPYFDRYGNIEGYAFNTDLEEDMHPDMHPFHREALVMINGYDPLLPLPLDDHLETCSLSSSWKVLSADFRNRLDDASMRHVPSRFSIRNLDEINPFSASKEYSESMSRHFFSELYKYQSTHELIAVPKFVWDTAHRKKILSEVEKLLSKPTGNVKWLKPSGRTLGTKAQWDSYLLFEEWTQAGYGRGKACGLASWELYETTMGRRSFGKDPKARKHAAKELLASPAGKKEPNYKDKIEGHVVCIENAIASVYPEFAPF